MVRARIPVDPAEFAMLNERFYRMAPARYLRTRLGALMITVGDADLSDAWKAGITYGSVRVSSDGDDDDEETIARHTTEYAAIESTMLMHHACETLLQLYLAHEYRTPCPWLALSEATDPRAFKNRLRQLRDELTDSTRVDDIVEVFTYTADRSNTSVPGERWQENRDALVVLIREAINVVLDQAKPYNAAKHGLALGAGKVGVSLGDPGETPLFERNGPALKYLEMAGPIDDRYWQTTTQWVEPERAIALVTVVILHIERLWQFAGAHRNKNAPPGSIGLSAMNAMNVAFGLDKEPGIYVGSMSERLRGGVTSVPSVTHGNRSD